MPEIPTVVRAGDVVTSLERMFLVIGHRDARALLVEMRPPNGLRHRADVSWDHRTEPSDCAVPDSELVFACGRVFAAPERTLARTGSVPGDVLARVTTARRRETVTLRDEHAFRFASTLTAVSASSGRRISAQHGN